MLNIRKFLEGLRILPKTTLASDTKGELEVLDSDGKLYYHNGSSREALITTESADILENKTIVVVDNTITTAASGNLTSTELNAALDELQDDIDTRATVTALNDHINDTTDAHDASAISVTPTGNLTADDVQEALVELQTDIDTINSGIADYVEGPASATDNAIARYDGTTGKIIQDSSITIGDSGDMSIANAGNNVTPFLSVFNTTSTTGAFPAASIRATSTGDAADNFGPRLNFSLSDNGVGQTTLGYISCLRDGADNSGRLNFLTQNAGVGTVKMYITPAGIVNVSGLTPSLPVKTDGSSNLVSGAVDLASSEVTGILPVANGGTGATTLEGASIVTGPASATDNAIARYDGTTGKLIQNSSLSTIGDDGRVNFTSDTFPVAKITRTSITATNQTISALMVKAETTQDMVNEFGSGIVYSIQDNAGLERFAGSIESRRADADTSSDLVFTCGNSFVERFRVPQTGTFHALQAAPVTESAATTLTLSDLEARIIQYTGAVANLQLPTGTAIEATGISTNMSFDFTLINTGTGVATLTTNTGITLVGAMVVANGTSGTFRVRKTTTNTFTIYRIS